MIYYFSFFKFSLAAVADVCVYACWYLAIYYFLSLISHWLFGSLFFVQVRDIVGAQFPLTVIDVDTQQNTNMSLGAFIDYYTAPKEARGPRAKNVISLEFSNTPLNDHVHGPRFVRGADWVSGGRWGIGVVKM